jgi:diguanylate cyclase (GGDEF)-like protein
VGTAALLLDALVVVSIYEALNRMRSIFLRVWISLAIALVLDSVVFSVGAFVESPRFAALLGAGIISKLIFAAPYAAALAIGRRLVPARSPDGAEGAVVELRTYRERYLAAQSEALRDALTGLRNRRALDGDLARTTLQSTYALLLIDIDHFKSVNDRFGHLAGDEVLKLVAHTLDRSLRAQDVAYRYGGEEFAVLLPEANRLTGIQVAERARLAVAELFGRDDAPIDRPVTVTIGVAVAPADGPRSEDLLACADRRLYQGKRGGRNRVVAEDVPAG